MRAPDRFEFIVEASHQREGMLAASKTLMTGRNAVLSGIITMLLTALAGFGGMALVTFITTLLNVSPTWWMLVGWFAGGALYLCSFQLLYSEMARCITKRALHTAPQALSFDATGMTYEAAPAVWTTPWAMIDDILETKQTITISVSGVAFVLPRKAVGDSDAVSALIKDLKAQIENA